MVLVLAPIAFFAALRPAAPRVVASSASAALSNNCDVHFVVNATTPLIAEAFGPSVSARCVDAVVVDEATPLIAQAFGPGISSAPHELQVHSVCVAREPATAIASVTTAATCVAITESKPRVSSSSPPSILNKALDVVRHASSRVIKIVSSLLFGVAAITATSAPTHAVVAAVASTAASLTNNSTALSEQERNLVSTGINSHDTCIEATDIPAPRPLHAPVSPAASLITLATGPSKSSASVRLHDRPHVHATADTCLITHDAGSSGTSAVETSDNIKVEAADASPPLDTSTLMSCSATELRPDEADQEVNKTNDENVNEDNNEKVNETKDEEVNRMNHEEISETNDEDISENRITPFVSQIEARHRRYHPLAQTIATTTAHPDGLCVCAEVPQTTTIAFQLAAQLLPDANAVEALMCRIVRTTTPKSKQSESPPKQVPSSLQSSSPFAPSTLGQCQTTSDTPRLITPYRIRVAGGVTGSVAARMSGRPKRNWRALLKLTHLTV
ncbi:hypothetical protein PINS_up003664 [Pythium insidiosum]|nr:hypothetical protein PINS_up003664 [Pythium insidiosum]